MNMCFAMSTIYYAYLITQWKRWMTYAINLIWKTTRSLSLNIIWVPNYPKWKRITELGGSFGQCHRRNTARLPFLMLRNSWINKARGFLPNTVHHWNHHMLQRWMPLLNWKQPAYNTIRSWLVFFVVLAKLVGLTSYWRRHCYLLILPVRELVICNRWCIYLNTWRSIHRGSSVSILDIQRLTKPGSTSLTGRDLSWSGRGYSCGHAEDTC